MHAQGQHPQEGGRSFLTGQRVGGTNPDNGTVGRRLQRSDGGGFAAALKIREKKIGNFWEENFKILNLNFWLAFHP